MAVREIVVGAQKLSIHEGGDSSDPATGCALTCSWIWDSALHLVEWMASDAGLDLSGKTVLELGAGTGLPGIAAAAALGASRVVLTDILALLPCLQRNAAANGLDGLVEVRELMWGSEEEEEEEVVDVVLLSDVFYDPGEMDGLARTLRRLCGEETAVLAASEVRESLSECLEVLSREGFVVEEMQTRRRPLLRSPEESSVFAVYLITLCVNRLMVSVRRP